MFENGTYALLIGIGHISITCAADMYSGIGGPTASLHQVWRPNMDMNSWIKDAKPMGPPSSYNVNGGIRGPTTFLHQVWRLDP